MADHRFDYPSAASPTSSIIFVRGAQLASNTPGMTLNQVTGETYAGEMYARNKGLPAITYPLTVIVAGESNSEADVQDLADWILTVAIGGVNAFDWTDVDGVVRRVRLSSGEVEFPKFGFGDGGVRLHSCDLKLRVEGAASWR